MTVIGSNRTLADLPGNYTLHFNCSNSPDCYFNTSVNLDRMIDHLGPQFESAALYDVLKCPKCKSRRFLVMFSPVHRSYGNASFIGVRQ